MDKYIPKLNIMEPRPWNKDKPQRPKNWVSFEYWETQFSDSLPTVENRKVNHPSIRVPF